MLARYLALTIRVAENVGLNFNDPYARLRARRRHRRAKTIRLQLPEQLGARSRATAFTFVLRFRPRCRGVIGFSIGKRAAMRLLGSGHGGRGGRPFHSPIRVNEEILVARPTRVHAVRASNDNVNANPLDTHRGGVFRGRLQRN